MFKNLTHIIGLLVGRKKFYYVGIILQHISHRMMGIGNYENMNISGELMAVKIIKSVLNTDKITFVDIGACDNAENSLLVDSYFSKAKIFAIEPMPNTFAKLRAKMSSKNNVTCVQVAISDKDGFIDLWDYKDKQTAHASTDRGHLRNQTKNIEKTRVRALTLKTLMNKLKLKTIDYLKIDTEGQEMKILKGSKECLNSISFIQFEFNSMNIYHKTTFKDFFDLLTPNFELFRIYQDGQLRIQKYNVIYQEVYEFQNYLAINKRYKKHTAKF